MITLLTFLFILGISIIIHEFGHFITAKRLKVRVEQFSLGFGPTLLKKKKNDTEYSIKAIPLGGYVKMAGDNLDEYKGGPDEYLSKSPGKRFQIIFCGSLSNYLLGFLCFWLIFVLGYPRLTTKVGGLMDGLGAKEAGLQAGDKITAIDGKRVEFWDELQGLIQTKKESESVKLSFLRAEKDYTREVKIKQKEVDDLMGKKRSIGLIGITPEGETVIIKQGFIGAFFSSVQKTLQLTLMTYEALWRMFSGQLSLRDSVTGPLGVFYITSQAAHLGIIAVLHLLAVLSVSLAIFNLLPFPVLDGGHIVLLAIEKIRGKALSANLDRVINQIGVSAIILFALFVTYNDLMRFFGDKITTFFK